MGSLGGRDDFCSQTVKYGFFISNFVIFIGGIVLFVLGLITLVDRNFMSELLGTNLFSGCTYVLVITSALVCVLAVFGCFGAVREVKCILLTYFILMFLIFVTMLIGGILGFVFREKVQQTMNYEMTSSIKLYGTRRQVTTAWDLTQSRLRCCGIQGHRDWGRAIPQTCCQEIDGFQRKPCQDYPTLSNSHNNGCYEVGLRFIQERAALMGTSGIIVAILTLFGMIFACLFFNKIE